MISSGSQARSVSISSIGLFAIGSNRRAEAEVEGGGRNKSVEEPLALDFASVVLSTSGRASLETAFMYGLFARADDTNNLPDSSNMWHETTSVLPLWHHEEKAKTPAAKSIPIRVEAGTMAA
jgi:hypothetical protein